MYKTLKLTPDGDISIDSLGRFVFIEDEESIIQTINIRLNTVKGELFYNLEYGVEKMVGFKAKDKYIELMQQNIENALVDGEKIISVFVNDIKRVKNGEYLIDLQITAENNEEIELAYNINDTEVI